MAAQEANGVQSWSMEVIPDESSVYGHCAARHVAMEGVVDSSSLETFKVEGRDIAQSVASGAATAVAAAAKETDGRIWGHSVAVDIAAAGTLALIC